MTTLHLNAMTGLEAALQNMTQTNFSLQLDQIRFQRLALGSLIRVRDEQEPAGDVTGTRLRGKVRLTVRAQNQQAAITGAGQLVRDLLGAGIKAWREQGFLELGLEAMDPLNESRPPGPTEFEQPLLFRFDYEFIQQPTQAGDRITTLDHDLKIDETTENFQSS